MEVEAAISGRTAHGSFVSPGLSKPANLSALLPRGPALMRTVVCSDIFLDILFRELLRVFCLVEDNIPEYYFA